MPRNSYRARRYVSTGRTISGYKRASIRAGYLAKRNQKKSGKRSGTTVGRSLGFPKTMMFKHRYVENIQLTATAGALAAYYWKANGMYDPNTTGTGHQPLYYDQLCALYSHYHIVGSKIKITMTASSNVIDGAPLFYGVFLNDDTSVAGLTYLAMQEQKLGKSQLSPIDDRENVQVFNYRFSAKKVYGGSVLANNSLQGSINTDPSELSYYTVWIAPADGASTIVRYIRVEVEYIAVWHELQDMPSS